ncbi:MAG TPA: hypothetical protein VFF11_01015 [Candidatus Binatia bacterium]|nr:hypothetical protein [Candidatus Binatia bacterium]
MNPSDKDETPSPGVPPPLKLSTEQESRSGPVSTSVSSSHSVQQMLVVGLSLCLGLFLADAVVSLADDSLILFCGSHVLSGLRGIAGFLTLLMSVGVCCLMGLTPKAPKRLFLPVALFQLAAVLTLYPFAIYFYGHLQQIAWGISVGQVLLGGWLLVGAQGGFKFRWPLVPAKQLSAQGFSWRNLGGFALVNALVLVPAILVYVFVCSSRAVNHFTDGFMALHPNGFSVQVRKYMRNDGKTIELFPMTHVADAGFYQHVEKTFPTNSIILMEGVTDSQNLLTNKISYARMARALGLAEQHEAFEPTRGKLVRADVDVNQFSADTIQLLNLVMLVQAKGATPENVMKLMEYAPSPKMEEELINDLLRNRNRHLMEEIKSHLSKTDHVMVPWGVAHMPGIAKEIQELGFRLVDSEDYMVIRFHGQGKQGGGDGA